MYWALKSDGFIQGKRSALSHAEDIDATYEEFRSLGSKIVEPLEKKPWGLRQFTVEDLDGNRFYFHCD